ncbi:DNA-directed RNA polymerase subunit beta [Bienertia sinuspersici]
MLWDGNEGMSTIPRLNQIQFEGFCRFIDQGLTEELYKFPKIEDTDQEIEFQLFVETYQLAEPLIKEKDAVYESLTYSSELYVSAGLIWKSSREMQEQTIDWKHSYNEFPRNFYSKWNIQNCDQSNFAKSGSFLRFYGYFFNGEVLSIHRSPLLHFQNLIDNLYSSNFLALPMNSPVIGLSQRDPPIQ